MLTTLGGAALLVAREYLGWHSTALDDWLCSSCSRWPADSASGARPRRCAGTQFDPAVVTAFLATVHADARTAVAVRS